MMKTCSRILVPAVAFAATAMAQVNVGPQKRIDVNGGIQASNETSMGASEANVNEIVGVWNDWRRSSGSEVINMGVAVSNDGGNTWTDFLVRPPAANQSGVEGDPMTAFDDRTGDLWVGAISFAGNGGIYVAKKNPGLNTFQPSIMARVSGGTDKCWMRIGPRPGVPNASNFYIAYNEGCIRSLDGGQTWSAPVALGSGIGFNPVIGPGGELYIAYWDFGFGVLMRRSLNGGVSFEPPITIATRMDTWGTQSGDRFPGQFRVPPMNYLGVNRTTGQLYCLYFDTTNTQPNGRNVDLYFTTSTNKGTSWTTPKVINKDNNPPGDQFWPWIEADKQGNLHVVFLDSRHTNQNDGVVNGMFDAYYAFSGDNGATWQEHRLTPNSFNSNNDGLNRGNQFLGDYMGLAVSGNRVWPCYLSSQNGDTDIYTHVIQIGAAVPTACCLPDGSCEDLLPSDCSNRGGRSTFGQLCSSTICPSTGACCIDDANCEQLTDFGCAARGGDYKGDGASCFQACPCDKIKKLNAKCKGGTLKATLKFVDTSMDGKPVSFDMGGVTVNTTVNGKSAKASLCCFSGTQTVTLLTPKGCGQSKTVTCN